MSIKEKTPASAATLNGVTETATCGTASISYKYYSTGEDRTQGPIERLLPQGVQNAITTADLVQLTGYSTARQLQKEIETERNHGALILSSSTGGYYLPSDGPAGKREIKDFINTLNSRAVSTLRTLRAARQALDEMESREKVF